MAKVFVGELYEDYQPFKGYSTWDYITKAWGYFVAGPLACLLFICAGIAFARIRRDRRLKNLTGI